MIRSAGLEDFDRIMELMVNFANASPLQYHHNPQYEDVYVRRLLGEILRNGVIIIGEHHNQIQGMIIANISTDAWLPHIRVLREMAWWVEPHMRNSTLGYKLLKKYVEVGNKMKIKGVIDEFTLTLMTVSPDFDLEKRGWRKIEHNYVYEGVN